MTLTAGYCLRMPLQETLDTFKYFITEADKLNLAYFALVRYHPFFDIEIDGAIYFIDRGPKKGY